MTQLAIAGGKGLGMFPGAEITGEYFPEQLNTPYGTPSGKISLINWEGGSFYCFSRHGDQQHLPPSEIPYLANAFALKQLGVKYWVSISLATALKGAAEPGCLVVADDYTSLGISRNDQFFGGKVAPEIVLYTDNYRNSVSSILKEAIRNASLSSGIPVQVNMDADSDEFDHRRLIVYAGVEGPQTGTLAEEKVLTMAFENVISGMTNMTEALVCKQAGIDFAGLSFVGGRGMNYSGVGNAIDFYLQNIDRSVVPLLSHFVREKLPKAEARDAAEFLGMCTGRKDIVQNVITSDDQALAGHATLGEVIKVILM